jgi:acyl carrier protein
MQWTKSRCLRWLLAIGAASHIFVSTKAPADTIAERVNKIVIEHLEADPQKVTPTAKIIQDLKADCLDVIELVMTMEEEFKKEIPDSVVGDLITVGDLINFIESNMSPRRNRRGSYDKECSTKNLERQNAKLKQLKPAPPSPLVSKSAISAVRRADITSFVDSSLETALAFFWQPTFSKARDCSQAERLGICLGYSIHD